MMDGWIKSYRKMFDNPVVCKDAEHLAVWVYLLHYAAHEEHDFIFNGQRMTIKQGQIITSRKSLSNKLHINESKVQRILKTFEIEQQIEQQTDRQKRLITLLNWDKYQKSEQPFEQRVNNDRTTSEQRVNTYNNDNKDKNEKNDINNNPPLSPLKEDWDKRSNKDNLIAYLNSGEYPNTDVFKQHQGLYEAIKEWMEYKDARKPKSQNHYTNTTSMMKFLNKAVRCLDIASEDAVIEIINDSLGNNYQGITWDRLIKGQAKPKAKVDRSGWTDD